MKTQALITMDAETLMTAPLPPPQFAIEGFLPQGLHILAGAPKIGKSWLALQLCLNVAAGNMQWNFPATKGSVLYLCLEDSFTRIQNRLLDLTDDAPETLHFATMSETIGGGLEAQIEDFLAEHPDTVMIVIDTLQRVRKPATDTNAYAGDYRDIVILKQLADKHRIAMLLIHHLRKMNDSDPMNMISGTTGISGATDSSFVLKQDRRGSSAATLYCVGRDIEYRELTLEFDKTAHIWNLVSDSVEAPEPLADSTIFHLSDFIIERGSFSGTATALVAELEARCGETLMPNVLVKKIIREQHVLAEFGISFSASRTRERRELRFTYSGDDSDGNDSKTDTGSVPN